ncbi:sugar transferase [Candidatus Beckwithbacteria bacterium]|nr:sugar transferase [Candidatus Beckwithbacteria bacterium]
MLERLSALFLLIFFSPLLVILYIVVELTSKGSFIFKQLRAGKNKKPFWIYKIRTMVEGAETQKSKLKAQNEADGPAFKIRNDPRYTKVGRFLAHTAIDEIPQLWNIIRGEMSFVGPRPLPVDEAKKIPKKYEKRFSVLPGMTSLWIVCGADHRSFKKWMELDLEYVKKKSLWYDVKIFFQTVVMVIKFVL